MKYLLILLPLFSPTYALADKLFDFVLVSNKCEMLVSINKLTKNSLRTVEGDLSVLFCSRIGRSMECDVTHAGEEDKVEKRKYTVGMDSPPYLIFNADNGSETALINSNENAASYTSRVIDSEYLGAKVCNMAFFTQDQFNALKGKNKP